MRKLPPSLGAWVLFLLKRKRRESSEKAVRKRWGKTRAASRFCRFHTPAPRGAGVWEFAAAKLRQITPGWLRFLTLARCPFWASKSLKRSRFLCPEFLIHPLKIMPLFLLGVVRANPIILVMLIGMPTNRNAATHGAGVGFVLLFFFHPFRALPRTPPKELRPFGNPFYARRWAGGKSLAFPSLTTALGVRHG